MTERHHRLCRYGNIKEKSSFFPYVIIQRSYCYAAVMLLCQDVYTANLTTYLSSYIASADWFIIYPFRIPNWVQFMQTKQCLSGFLKFNFHKSLCQTLGLQL